LGIFEGFWGMGLRKGWLSTNVDFSQDGCRGDIIVFRVRLKDKSPLMKKVDGRCSEYLYADEGLLSCWDALQKYLIATVAE